MNILGESDPQNALYAVFTPSSTGEPKGVVIDHAAFYSASPHKYSACCVHLLELGEVGYQITSSISEAAEAVAEVVKPQGDNPRPLLIVFIRPRIKMVWGTSRTDGSNDLELIEQPNYLFYLDIAAIQSHLQRNLLNPPVNIILATVIKAAWTIVIGELFTSTTNSCADIKSEGHRLRAICQRSWIRDYA